jgi:two-component system catabolic regulation response regulator CreB
MRPLAIIENDVAFAARLRAAIEAAGFRTELFETARPALALIHDRTFALAIIDLGIEDIDPFELCRDASPIVPLIALTTGPADETCVRAIESGADDCICRPLVDRELIARVRNVLRRAQDTGAEHDQLNAVIAEMRVRVGDDVRDLTTGEAAVLAALLDHAPAPMTVLDIANTIGAKRGTVESRIKSLRQKLGRGRLVSRGRLGYQLE